MLGPHCISQQGNDPKNTARVVKQWLHYYASPDLNSLELTLIEHVWEIMKQKVVPKASINKQELKETLQKSWSENTLSETEYLVLFMPRSL